MYKYSKSSELQLASCHIDLQLICHRLLKHFDHSVLCGHRGKEDQNKAFAEGKSNLKFPNGKHNSIPSMAVDIAPYPREKNKKADIDKFCVMVGRFLQIADELHEKNLIIYKIRWGRLWKNGLYSDEKGLLDYAHLELIEE